VPARPVVLAVAALQLGVPLTMLGLRWAEEGSRPRSELPASYQMYSSEPPVTYTGTDALGRRRALEVGALPPVLRAVDTGRVVPDLLCRRHRDVVAVGRDGGVQPGTFRC
jgi:hypothetical protein